MFITLVRHDILNNIKTNNIIIATHLTISFTSVEY